MGRPKGSVNKPKKALLRRLQDAFGDDFHPIMKMSQIAMDEQNNVETRLNAWKEVAKYVEPQLKAVEHSVGDEAARFLVSGKPMTEAEWQEQYGDRVESAEGTATGPH